MAPCPPGSEQRQTHTPRAPVSGSVSASPLVGPFLQTRRGLCVHFVGKEMEKLPSLCPLRGVTVSLVARRPGKQGSEGRWGQDLGPGRSSGLGWGHGGQGMPDRPEISEVLGNFRTAERNATGKGPREGPAVHG